MLLHELFERQAQARAGSPALLCGGRPWTYAELEARANRLARLLRRRGAGQGACVGLWLPRSADLYAALLGILKAGAAYVPIDPAYPADRAKFILEDSQASALVTTRLLAAQLQNGLGENSAQALSKNGPALVLMDDDETGRQLASESASALTRAEAGLTPQDLCYVIYTSGTTGRPKGVQIEHRSAAHLVQTEGRLFEVRPEDRVYQGFSIAFDASVEEVWLAFFAGATLVAGTPEMERAGPGLSRLLAESGVTVLSCVPTLLAMLEDDIPTVRLLILGGEACPPELVERWWRPARRVFNTYGPTEATVIATCGECRPQKPLTIGKPLPGYFVAIVDEQMRALPAGAPGELCLGGVGLARGYLGRDDLTREKFVPNPFAPSAASGVPASGCPSKTAEDKPEPWPARLYKTGDLACWTPDGEIQFLGRLDSQVKIRGFRVELAEIEAVLLQCPGVQAAAVALREDTPGLPQLVAYLVPRGIAAGPEAPAAGPNGALDPAPIRESLRKLLPAYMVPAILETLPELPLLPSGKVDRKRLPPPRARPAEQARRGAPPVTPVQRQIAAVWEKLFAPLPVSLEDNFFLDLGGHSLLAARMVSELRRQPSLAQLSMLDIYRHPTIEALAEHFEAGIVEQASRLLSPPTAAAPKPQTSAVRLPSQTAAIPFWRHFFCGTAQLASLVFILSFFAIQWLGPYLTYTVLVEEGFDVLPAIGGACASLVLVYPFMLLFAILAKWVLIGRYQAAHYPLWGFFYFRWWLYGMIEAAVPVDYLAGTPLLNLYLRLMGAKIGPNVHLDTSTFAVYDLVSIGANTSINVDSNLLGYTVEDGLLKLGRITIGSNCFVGARSALRENTVMEDGAALENLSLLQRGARIPAGQTWRGSPARPINPQPSPNSTAPQAAAAPGQASPETPVHSRLRRVFLGLFYALSLLIIPVFVAAALFPGIVVMNELNYIDPYYWYLLLAPLVGLSFVVLLCLEIAAVKWLVVGKVKPGSHAVHGSFYVRKWLADKMLDLSLDVLGPLYASIYLKPWYTLLGARLGVGAEVSTASFISPDLLSIGDESFIADSVSLGAPRVRDGRMTLGRNHVGKRSFVGNSAMLPPGAILGDNMLIGCLSAPPDDPAEALREDAAWLGSPAVFLPQRQKSSGFSEETTYHPPPRLRVQRALIEFVRVITPSTCFIILISLLFSALLLLHDFMTMREALLFFPFLYLGCGLAAALFTIAAKWILVWRYRPGERPLWSTFVWRNELLNALHEHLAEPFLVGALTGTPFVCWYFRLLGARIGKRVYMETTDFSEFDLAAIGDEAALNADCTIQTHLFEDRVMKMSTVILGPRCKVGAGSLVLYDTRMEAGSSLGDLSLLMKGETLPAGTSWEGVPATNTNSH
jgi:non-ribosomal peptide synthetase-like protein